MAAAGWLHPADADPAAAVRLFLFHHSGGSVAMYREWLPLLPSDVAAQCVALPGRAHRRHETPFTRLEPLVAAITDVLDAELDDRPYAFFGHSMGALLAYRVAVALRGRGAAAPGLVAASGWAPAGFAAPAGALGDEEVVQAMHRLGGLPRQVRTDPDLLGQTVSAMRADLAVCAGYHDDDAVLGSPVVAYSGRDDPLLAPEAMASWSTRTAEFLGHRRYPGGHFFLDAHAVDLTIDLVQLLRRHLTVPTGTP